MLLNVIFVDPGGESGVAWACWNPKRNTTLAPHQQVQRAFALGMGGAFQTKGDTKDQVLEIQEFVEERRLKANDGRQQAYKVRTLVGCESFTPPSKHVKDSVLLAHTVFTQLEFYLWLMYPNDEIEWCTQRPGEHNAVTDDMLRKWDLWLPGKANDDAVAAIKHLIVKARKLHAAV